jgi:hypothetical protein
VPGWRSTDENDDRRTDGGTEDDAVADIKRMLSEGDDDGTLTEAVEGDEGADELDEDFKMDFGLGLSLPTVAVMGLGVLFFLFWPAVFALLNGPFVEAIISLVVAAIATIYFVGPALVGSYVGGFVGERIAT